jgi:sugar lactone lactonase YvrE
VINGKQGKLTNDIDIDKEGNIYYSVSSTNGGGDYFLMELLGEPSGRLMKYDPKTKKSKVLVEGIHMANGVQLSKNEDFVMVSELLRSRVMR